MGLIIARPKGDGEQGQEGRGLRRCGGDRAGRFGKPNALGKVSMPVAIKIRQHLSVVSGVEPPPKDIKSGAAERG